MLSSVSIECPDLMQQFKTNDKKATPITNPPNNYNLT